MRPEVQNLAMFVGGLLGSGHCIGMCGGFAMTVGALCPRMPAGLLHQAIYSAGRIFTYGFLGAMAAWAGARLGAQGSVFSGAQQVLAIAAGVLMIAFGLSTFGLISFRRQASERPGATLVTSVGSPGGVAASYDAGPAASFFGHFLRPTAPRGVFLAGVFTGFLPCGLVYAFLAFAASMGDPLAGWLGMACFGLGTVPAMVLAGFGGAMVTVRWRARVQRIAAAFVVVLGAVTLYRGVRQGPCHGAASAPDCCQQTAPAFADTGFLPIPSKPLP